MANKDDELEQILKEITGSANEDKAETPAKEEHAPVKEQNTKDHDEPAEVEMTKPDYGKNESYGEEHNASAPTDDAVERHTAADPYLDSFEPEIPDNSLDEWEDEGYEDYAQDNGGNKKNKIVIAVIIAVALIAAVVCGVYFAFFNNKQPETTAPPTTTTTTTTTTAAPVIIKNPLTGEEDYNEAALELRPIAISVDNASGARPQYNITAADMIVEGEVEGGETRLTWFLADMTNLPEQLGPTRSARPSYVQFSELFDAIFVHYGGSHSKGDYVGGYETIKKDGVDNIDGMTVSSCFKRTSDKKAPHNAALLGNKLVAAIEKKGYRTTVDKTKFTQFNFNDSVIPVSQNPCNSLTVKFSSSTGSRKFNYDSAKKVYTNDGFYKTDISFTNIITLFAESTYIVKYNYMQQGRNETYCNYSLTSGTGKLISCGTVVDLNWRVSDGKLVLTDTQGKPLNLNPGKSYIGLASSNYNGSVTIAEGSRTQ